MHVMKKMYWFANMMVNSPVEQSLDLGMNQNT